MGSRGEFVERTGQEGDLPRIRGLHHCREQGGLGFRTANVPEGFDQREADRGVSQAGCLGDAREIDVLHPGEELANGRDRTEVSIHETAQGFLPTLDGVSGRKVWLEVEGQQRVDQCAGLVGSQCSGG